MRDVEKLAQSLACAALSGEQFACVDVDDDLIEAVQQRTAELMREHGKKVIEGTYVVGEA